MGLDFVGSDGRIEFNGNLVRGRTQRKIHEAYIGRALAWDGISTMHNSWLTVVGCP